MRVWGFRGLGFREEGRNFFGGGGGGRVVNKGPPLKESIVCPVRDPLIFLQGFLKGAGIAKRAPLKGSMASMGCPLKGS